MEKQKTPVSTIIFYIIGIILLLVSLFMLWTAVNYTENYLQSYDAKFSDMWSNTLQYVIAQFMPYCGMGVICIGLGKAINSASQAKAQQALPQAQPQPEAEEAAPVEAAAEPMPEGTAEEQIADLARRIDTNREVLSIKIEEKEKRDSFRIKELEKKVENFLSDVKYINEPLEELVYKQAVGEDAVLEPEMQTAADNDQAEAESAPAAVPQIMRMAGVMSMPAIPQVEAADTEDADDAEAADAAVPQIMRMASVMSMPSIPRI